MEQNGEGGARISRANFHGLGEAVVACSPERGDGGRAQEGGDAGSVGVARAAAVFKAHRIPQSADVVPDCPVGEERWLEDLDAAVAYGLEAAQEMFRLQPRGGFETFSGRIGHGDGEGEGAEDRSGAGIRWQFHGTIR